MLQTISIRDFAIVPRQDLEFEPGFTVITGETGAGKSLIVDALGLLGGDRADTDQIREGADKAELAAEFRLHDGHPAFDWLAANEMDDGDTCLLRRVISRSGRSRAWINGTPVTLNQLQELGESLIEIHGQHQHLLLNHAPERYRLLDSGGDHGEELSGVREAFAAWQALDSEYSRLEQASPLDAGEIELLRHQLRELEAVALPAEEVLELEAEHKRLTRGSELSAALEFAGTSLAEQNAAESFGVVEGLHRILAALEPIADADPRITGAVQMLGEAAINCEEARQDLSRAQADMDLSPERLAAVERQLGDLHDAARKHRVAIDALLQARDALADRIETATSLETRLEGCRRERERALASFRREALRLHQARCARAETLSEAVTEAMQELAMAGGRFMFSVEHDPQAAPSARGSDRLSLLVSANPGIQPAPLRKVASGGELSRISLAIKVAAGRLRKQGPDAPGSGGRTQVFDEVDAGIGGDAANAVGRMLRDISGGGQTVCVTHLAQVAARAHHQIKVEKRSGKDRVQIDASPLAAVAREEEIARMLSGTVSENSLAHARELIKNAAA